MEHAWRSWCAALWLVSGAVFLSAAPARACEPCRKRAMEFRQTAASARAEAAKLNSRGTALPTGGTGGPSLSSQYAAAIRMADQEAARLEGLYQQCRAGQQNVCSGAAGGSGANSPGPAQGGQESGPSPSALLDQTRTLFQGLQNQSEANVARSIQALNQLNEQLARTTRAEQSRAALNQAARDVGNANLDEVGADESLPINVPGATYHSVRRPAPSPTTPSPTPASPMPAPVEVVPSADVPREIDFTPGAAQPPVDRSALDTLVPLEEVRPSQEQLFEAMARFATEPPDEPPNQVLGTPLSVPADAQASQDFPLGLDESGKPLGAVAEEVATMQFEPLKQQVNDSELVKEMRQAVFDPMQEAETAVFDNGGAGMKAGADIISRDAPTEQGQKDIANAGHVAAGAMDRLERTMNESPESAATSREQFLQNVEEGYPDLMAYAPAPVKKALELRDKAIQKLNSAQQTAESVIQRGRHYLDLTKDAFGRDSFVARSADRAAQGAAYIANQTLQLFGYKPEAR